MDGTTFITDLASGRVLQEGPSHRKYVVRVCWSPDGTHFATASYDKTAALWRLAEDVSETEAETPSPRFEERHIFHMQSPVECITMLPALPDASSGGPALVLGQRDDCRLAVYALADLAVTYINMNELGDDFVSFAPMDVAASPDGRFLLVSTDKDRVIIMSREHRCLVGA
jgi:COMPASS component SWD3